MKTWFLRYWRTGLVLLLMTPTANRAAGAATDNPLPPMAAPLLLQDADLAPPTLVPSGNRCGAAVAVDEQGKFIVVGCPGDPALGANAGTVHVLDVYGRPLARLVPEGARADWQVGSQVAISSGGRWVAVRASRMPVIARVAVYVFERVITQVTTNLLFDSRIGSVPVTNWVQRAVLDSPTLDRSFGTALAFQNTADASTVLAIGAPLDEGGRVHLYTVQNGVWSKRGTLAANGQGPFDEFGTSLSFYGERLAIGAPNTSSGRGAVYLFQVRTSPWTAFQEQQLTRWPSAGGERFGESVAFVSSGDLLVGVPGVNVVAGAVVRNAGLVEVFQQDGNEFRFRGRLQDASPSVNAHFGARVGGRGGFLVSAPGASNGAGRIYYGEFRDDSPQLLREVPNPYGAGAAFGSALASSGGNDPVFVCGASGVTNDTGAVLITRLSPGALPQFTRLDGDRATPVHFAAGLRFGTALAMDGDTLVVGMPQDRNPGRWRGAVYVYERRGAAWQFTQRLEGDDAVPHADFGAAVTVHGNRLAVGAPSITAVEQRRGAVFLFERANGSWRRQGEAIQGPEATHQAWGAAVSLWDTRLAVGAPAAANRRGQVALFGLNPDGQWQWDAELTPPNGGNTNAFGGTLVLRNATLIVGEPGGLGSVHVYQQNGGPWVRVTSLSAQPGTSETAEMQRSGAFGASLAFDGYHLAVGQPDMPFTRLPGGAVQSRRGRVHLFATSGWSWSATVSAGVDNDQFGAALALNGDNLLVGAPGNRQALLFQRTGAKGWTQEFPAGLDRLAGPAGGEWGATLVLGDEHLVVANPAGQAGGFNPGTLTPYRVEYRQANQLAEYVRDLLYPRRNVPGGVRDRDNAAFQYLARLYVYDPDDTQRRVKILPSAITNLWTEVQQARADLAEGTLLRSLGAFYAAGQPPGTALVKPVEELLLDIYHDRAVAESLLARHWLRDLERQRIEGHPNATGFVIDLEIPKYHEIAAQERRALETYFELFRRDLLPGFPELGRTLFVTWVPGRNLRAPTFADPNDTDQPVGAQSQVYAGGYQDLILLYNLLRDHAEHVRTLAELYLARSDAGDSERARAELAQARQILFLHSTVLAEWLPDAPNEPGQDNGLGEARAGVGREINRIEALQHQMDLGLNPLGFDPEMLLLFQKSDRNDRYFNSFESFLDYLREPGSDLDQALKARAAAQTDYDQYRDRRDQFEHHLQLYNTAYDDRLFDIWGKHRADIREGEDPRTNIGGGIWQAWQGVEAARNRLRRNLLEIDNLRGRIRIEVERRGQERAINNAIAQVHIQFANRQADLTETLGHIEAAQAGFNSVMESLSAEKVTKGGVVLGLVKGAGNAAAEEAKARYQAQKERLAGLEQAQVKSLEDQLLDAASQAMIKNLLLDIQAALVDCEEANILLEQSLGQYQALLDEGYDLFNRIAENNLALGGRYFADPIHALRAARGLARANLTFAEAQRWVFYLARALEYKWNEPFRFDHAGRKSLSLASVFRARNAAELEALVNAMDAYDRLQQPQRIQGEPFDYFSVREDFFGYKRLPGDPKIYPDPVTGEPTDALGAFRSRLRQAIAGGDILLRFNTVRPKGTFFLGPEFCDTGLLKSQLHRGTYLDKISWMAVRLRVSRISPFEEERATGALFYGGTSYIRNRQPGQPSTASPDLIKNELTSYPVRRWFQSQGRWSAEDGLVISTLSMLKYQPRIPGEPEGINRGDLSAAERITGLKERPVAATDWRLSIRADSVNLDTLEDIYICFGHVAAERLWPGETCQ
jgi:hypothetical protein